MIYLGKRVLVVGAGLSGQAVCKFLQEKQSVVTLTDTRTREQIGQAIVQLSELGIELILGEYPSVDKGQYDMLVMSPGVPLTILPVVQAKKFDIPVLGEWMSGIRVRLLLNVAITGDTAGQAYTILL